MIFSLVRPVAFVISFTAQDQTPPAESAVHPPEYRQGTPSILMWINALRRNWRISELTEIRLSRYNLAVLQRG